MNKGMKYRGKTKVYTIVIVNSKAKVMTDLPITLRSTSTRAKEKSKLKRGGKKTI